MILAELNMTYFFYMHNYLHNNVTNIITNLIPELKILISQPV